MSQLVSGRTRDSVQNGYVKVSDADTRKIYSSGGPTRERESISFGRPLLRAAGTAPWKLRWKMLPHDDDDDQVIGVYLLIISSPSPCTVALSAARRRRHYRRHHHGCSFPFSSAFYSLDALSIYVFHETLHIELVCFVLHFSPLCVRSYDFFCFIYIFCSFPSRRSRRQIKWMVGM